MQEASAQMEGRYRELQSQCAAEVSDAAADRLHLAEVVPRVDKLTSINHKLTAALAVAQLQAAAGINDLLSQVFPFLPHIACLLQSFFRLDYPRCPQKPHNSGPRFY